MMKHHFLHGIRWVALFFVPMLIMAACAQTKTEPAPTSIPNPSTGSVAKATPVPTTPPQTSQTTKSQEDVLYEDNFKDPKSGWPNALVFDNYFVGYHEPDYYHVDVRAQHDSAVVVLPGRSFDNFSAEVSVFADEANTAKSGDFRYGLVVRRSGHQFYAFTVSPRTKTWTVLKSSPSGLQVLAKGSDNSIKGIGVADKLGVDARGPVLAFQINGHSAGQVSDADYTSGGVGFFVETIDAPRAHIHYDTLAIRKVRLVTTSLLTGSKGLCKVTSTGLNLRRGPGIEYAPPLTALPRSTALVPLARNPDATWIQVQVQDTDQTGWVAAAARYVTCDVSVSEFPVGELPSN